MQCFMKNEDKSLIYPSVASPAFCATYFTAFSMVCSLFYPVDVIRLNIATTSAHIGPYRLKFEL